MEIFRYEDYRKYLKSRVETVFRSRRGHLTYLAKEAQCQPSYMTKILSGAAELSLEQAILLNEPLQHSVDEGRFFMLLVQFSRAGTPALRSYFKDLMNQQRVLGDNLSSALELRDTPDPAVRSSQLYEHWWHVAILAAINLKGVNEPISISKRLNLPIGVVQESLQLLERLGYIKKLKNTWVAELKRSHVAHKNTAVLNHHINWRMKEIEKLNLAQVQDKECYTSVICLSKSDLEKIRQILLTATQASKNIISDSPEEVLACFSWSLFEI